MDCDVLITGGRYAVFCACGDLGLSVRGADRGNDHGGGYLPGRAAGDQFGAV